MLEWLKKKKYKILGVVISMFLVPMLIVHILFKINLNIPFLQAEWSAGELLGYIAGFEIFLGTSCLSVLALVQNEIEKDKNSFLEKSNIKRPFFIIDRVTYKDGKNEKNVIFDKNRYVFSAECSKHCYVYLRNVGEGIANEFRYEPYGFGRIPEYEKPTKCIPINEECCIPISLHSKDGSLKTKTYHILYKNVVGICYKQNLIVEADITYNPKILGEPGSEYIEDEGETFNTYINLISPQENDN